MNPLEEFHAWTGRVSEDLKTVEKLLAQPLSDEPESLIQDLLFIEAYNARIGYILAQADGHLDACSFLFMPPKEGHTEFERKIELDEKVNEMRKWRNRIQNLSESIKTRITMGQSILRYQSQFFERNQLKKAS